MNKVLIIKVGSTIPTLTKKRGDFEDWIMSGMHVNRDRVTVIDVTKGAPLPLYRDLSGVVITGSHAMVTEHHAWSEMTAHWLRGAVDWGMPILGICYGHQLLAYALGGEVGNNPKGREFGTVAVRLHTNGKDPLFGHLDSPIKVHVCHTQSVLRLPENATCIAASAMDKHAAFVINGCAWGVQFHPEFDAEIVMTYISHYSDVLRVEGQSPDMLRGTCINTPYGSEILQHFAHLTHVSSV